MTTAIQLLNKILAKLRRPTKALTVDFTTFSDTDLVIVSNLQQAQDQMMLDCAGFYPLGLYGTKSDAAVAAATTYVTLPTDLYANKINEFYVLDSDGNPDGNVRLLSQTDHLRNGSYYSGMGVYVYPSGANLYFSDETTVVHSFKMNYVKQPTDLSTYGAVFDFPEQFENCLINKAIYLSCVDLDISINRDFYEAEYQKYLRKAKSTLKKSFNSQMLSDDTMDYFSGTW